MCSIFFYEYKLQIFFLAKKLQMGVVHLYTTKEYSALSKRGYEPTCTRYALAKLINRVMIAI
jgi:hypothetical protein